MPVGFPVFMKSVSKTVDFSTLVIDHFTGELFKTIYQVSFIIYFTPQHFFHPYQEQPERSLLCGAGIVSWFQKFPYYLAVLAYGLFAFLLTKFFEIAVYSENFRQ